MSDKIEILVRGEPRPKGSKNAYVVNFPYNSIQKLKTLGQRLIASPNSWRPITTVSEVSKGLKKWEKEVKKQAEIAMATEAAPFDGPIRLTMIFYMARPKMHMGTGRNADKIKDRYVNALPLKVPDLSKLFRAAEDGLNEVVFKDDSQVVEMVSKKLLHLIDVPRSAASFKA